MWLRSGWLWGLSLVAGMQAGCEVGALGGAAADGAVGRTAVDGSASADWDGAAMSDRTNAETDASTPDASGAWPLARTYPLTTTPVQGVQLVSDDHAVYGLTRAGAIWALDVGAATPRRLVAAVDSQYPASSESDGYVLLASAGEDLFWTDRFRNALHRTHKDGSADDLLAINLQSPGMVAADDNRVYWLEDTYQNQGGGVIRSLPLDAAPGDPAATLVKAGQFDSISSIAAANGALFWTPFDSIGSTVYYASLLTAPVATLLAGGAGTGIACVGQPYGVVASEGKLYFGYYRDLWTTVVAGLSDSGGTSSLLSILPVDVYMTGVTVSGDWLLVTGAAVGGRQDLYVAPASGAGMVIVAHGLGTPAIVGPSGVTFIDSSGRLVAFPLSELGYLAFGQPAP
jgi:hypothetical protein